MSRSRLLAALLAATIACLPDAALAARLGSGLERRLASFGPADSVSLILELADRVDLNAFSGGRAGARGVIAQLRDRAPRTQQPLLGFLAARGYRPRSFWINNSVAVRVSAALLPELERRTDLAAIEFDEPARVVGESFQWNLTIIRAEQTWPEFDGGGVLVGSMDTGFDPNHPAIAGKWRGGANSWRDVVHGQPAPYDDHGHGTHTLGTVLGGDGPGPFNPDIGLAYGATFIAVKVMDASMFSNASTLIAGAQWMLDPDGNPATDDFPDVINNSWGFFDSNYQGFHSAVAAWRAAGIFPVFAIGNSGPNAGTTVPPGNYDNTLGVGATDAGDFVPPFSSRGPSPIGPVFPADRRKPEISAPGEGVSSSLPGGGYDAWSGTSMAAPHVSGTVALMLQAHGGPMSFDELRTILLDTAVDFGIPGYDHDYGYGRLDALGAVTQAIAPTAHVIAGVIGNDVHLHWNPAPDVLHYDVYRSPASQDAAGELLASTTDTSYVDPDRFGRTFYRLRPVLSSGPAPFTNEVVLNVCPMEGPFTQSSNALTSSPVVADFNGDGFLDVTLANVSSSTVRISLGDGTGALGPLASFAAGARPFAMAAGDFDGDAILDLAVTNNVTTGTVSILRGNGAGGFAAPVAHAAGNRPAGIACADFDQDGILDLAVACNGSSSVVILRGNGAGGAGDGTLGAPVSYPVATGPLGLVTADFDRDGALDLAVAANSAARVSVLLGHRDGLHADGSFTVGTSAVCAFNPTAIVTGDFDADDTLDVAVSCRVDPGFVSILFGRAAGENQSVFAPGVDHPAGALPQGIATADMNGDGIVDVLVADTDDDAIAVLLGTGQGGVADGGFERPALLMPGGSPSDLAIGDFDRNGVPDLAISNAAVSPALTMLYGACASEAGTALTLLAPNGGETWPASTWQVVSWAQDPGVVSVDVELSRDGVTWQTLASHWTGTSFAWFVSGPATPAATARIRVRDSRVSSEDASDAGFTIGPDIRLATPAPILKPSLSLQSPALGRLVARFVLPDRRAASLEVVDVTGRRIVVQDVAALGAGAHALDLGRGLSAGIYWVRLVREDRAIARKAVLLR